MGVTVLVLALVLAGYVWMRVAQARGAESDRERTREGYRRMIARDPRNVGAYEALGDSLRQAGRLAEARDCYQQALASCGEGIPDAQIHYKIRHVDLTLQERVFGAPSPDRELVLCPQCGATNPPSQRVCETCNTTMPYRQFREALRDKEIQRATWECAAVCLVLAVVLFVFQSLELDVKGVLVMAAIIVMAWRFLQAIGPKRV
jgi:tetratricopeptide (TPR) repeat protein